MIQNAVSCRRMGCAKWIVILEPLGLVGGVLTAADFGAGVEVRAVGAWGFLFTRGSAGVVVQGFLSCRALYEIDSDTNTKALCCQHR